MTARRIEFTVYGKPITKGDKQLGRNRDNTKAWLRENNANELRAWTRAIEEEGMKHRQSWTRQVPLAVTLYFNSKLPTRDHADGDWCAVPPDSDKLERAVFDALKRAKCIVDDGQICRNLTETHYGSPLGVHITIRELL